jgi:hypothetical protein
MSGTNTTAHIGQDQLNEILYTLPNYTEFELEVLGVPHRLRFLARDIPRPGRRLTCLDTGTEWFTPLSDNIEVIAVHVPEIHWSVS